MLCVEALLLRPVLALARLMTPVEPGKILGVPTQTPLEQSVTQLPHDQ